MAKRTDKKNLKEYAEVYEDTSETIPLFSCMLPMEPTVTQKATEGKFWHLLYRLSSLMPNFIGPLPEEHLVL